VHKFSLKVKTLTFLHYIIRRYENATLPSDKAVILSVPIVFNTIDDEAYSFLLLYYVLCPFPQWALFLATRECPFVIYNNKVALEVSWIAPRTWIHFVANIRDVTVTPYFESLARRQVFGS
jgi:hypothetical protein